MLSFDKNKDALVGTLKQSLVRCYFSYFVCVRFLSNVILKQYLFNQLQLEALGSQRASFEEMLEEMKRKVKF